MPLTAEQVTALAEARERAEEEQTIRPVSTAEIARIDPAMERGPLAFQPGQRKLSDDQRAALSAIVNFDPEDDKAAIPHINVFSHLCQARGLDPYAKEAYLIKRGEGSKATYTMQVGIDGFRKMGRRTGRFIRRVGWYWTGSEDANSPVDSPWWRFDADEEAYERVWVKVWLPGEQPAAAKCAIEHYDESGNRVRTSAVGNWRFYAPEYPKWHWGERRGEKVYETDDDGNQIMEVSDMWQKGGPHMLAKCSEAQALRAAFPAEMSGIYAHEEMARADAMERVRAEAERARLRNELVSRPWEPKPPGAVIEGTVVVEDTPDTPEGLDVEALTAELAEQARVLGSTPRRLATRQVAARKKNLDDFNPEELEALVASRRKEVEEALLRESAKAPSRGKSKAKAAEEPTPVPEVAETPTEPQEAPEAREIAPHDFAAWEANGKCWCGQPETDPVHVPGGEA